MNKNFFVYLAGNVAFGFTQWFVIVLIIKLGTKLELGAYTYGIAVIAPILLLMSFGYNTLIITKSELHKSMVYLTRWCNMILAFVLYTLLIFFFSNIEVELYKLMGVIALSKIADSLMEIDYSYYIKANVHWKVGLYKIILSSLQLSLIALGYYVFDDLFLPLLIYSCAVISYATYTNRKQFIINTFSWKQFAIFLKFGLPLSIALFLSSLNTNIPKYTLEKYTSLADVGIFSSLIIIYSAGNIFYFSMYNFLLPRVVNQKCNKQFLKRLLYVILTSNALVVITLMTITPIVMEPFILLLFNKQYLVYKTELLIIICSSFAIYSSILLDLFINAFQKYSYNTITQIISVIVVFICSAVLIPSYSVFGATIAFVLFGCTVFSLKLILSIFIVRGVKHGA